jgi:hypothetical protein
LQLLRAAWIQRAARRDTVALNAQDLPRRTIALPAPAPGMHRAAIGAGSTSI